MTTLLSPRKRILVVEDDAPTARMLARILRDHDVVVAEDGAAGLERARAMNPDLIVTDAMMPRLHGFDMVRALKSDPSTKRIPVIFFSAMTSAADVAAAVSVGARSWLPKPIDIRTLVSTVQRALA